MDRVRRATMHKSADNGGKDVPNVALILMATFVCGCIRRSIEPRHVGTKCHYLLRFYLSPVLRRMGLAQMPRNVPVSWTLPNHLSFVDRFFRTNTFDHKSIGQWSARNVLQALQGNDSMDPVAWFPERTAQLVWQNASSPVLTNKHQDLAWLAVRGALPVRSFLHRRNLTTSAHCPRDGCYGEETVAHLFKECGFARRVWRGLQGSLSRFIPSSSVTEDSVLYGLQDDGSRWSRRTGYLQHPASDGEGSQRGDSLLKRPLHQEGSRQRTSTVSTTSLVTATFKYIWAFMSGDAVVHKKSRYDFTRPSKRPKGTSAQSWRMGQMFSSCGRA
ncbi:uncharacterized protein LOC144602450 [Rhinoraja longicauda]